MTRRSVVNAVLAISMGAVVALRPAPTLPAHLAAPGAWVAADGADRVTAELAGAALWLLACWLTLALGAWALTGLPGAAGRAARRTAWTLLPRVIARVLLGAGGAGVVLASAGAAVAPAAPAAAAAVAAPAWPSDAPLPAPHWPVVAVAAGPPPAVRRGAHDDRGATIGGRAPVVVRPGDTLWSIAAAHLGTPHLDSPRRSTTGIAASWPRWFAANRAVVGDDPDLIRPGQVLRPPVLPESHR